MVVHMNSDMRKLMHNACGGSRKKGKTQQAELALAEAAKDRSSACNDLRMI